MEPKYKRVVLKISGEALAGDSKTGISDEMLTTVAKQVKEIKDMGVQIAIVVGGGNFWQRQDKQVHGQSRRRLYGDAGNGDQFAGAAGRI